MLISLTSTDVHALSTAYEPPQDRVKLVVAALDEYAQRSIAANDALQAGVGRDGTSYAALRRRAERFAEVDLAPALKNARSIVCNSGDDYRGYRPFILRSSVRIVQNARYFDSLEPAHFLADIAACNGSELVSFLTTLEGSESRQVARLVLFMLGLPPSAERPRRTVELGLVEELRRMAR
jgi:hypothetical protein